MPVPVFSVGETLTSAAMNAVGLWRITTCTVSSVGGTAATASNGVVTIGTSNTSVTVNNAFSSSYDNYRIVISSIDCSSPDTVVLMTMGNTTTNYYGNMAYYKVGSGNGDLPRNNENNWYVAITDGESATGCSFDLFAPNKAVRTSYTGGGWGYLSVFTTAGMVANTTQYTSFTIAPAAGSMTGGTICVYGYNK